MWSLRPCLYEQAKTFYDRFGKKQDSQSFYEDVATEALIRSGEFDSARAIFELGCGTGRFGERLLERYPNAKHVGVDISGTMVALTKERLIRFGHRAQVHLVDGSPHLGFPTGAFDRFVSNYVLDLLAFEDICTVLREAWRILLEDGLLGLVSLTHGFTFISRIVGDFWKAIYEIGPMLVGGCRPIDLFGFITAPYWSLRFVEKFSSYGVPSDVLAAEKVAMG